MSIISFVVYVYFIAPKVMKNYLRCRVLVIEKIIVNIGFHRYVHEGFVIASFQKMNFT